MNSRYFTVARPLVEVCRVGTGCPCGSAQLVESPAQARLAFHRGGSGLLEHRGRGIGQPRRLIGPPVADKRLDGLSEAGERCLVSGGNQVFRQARWVRRALAHLCEGRDDRRLVGQFVEQPHEAVQPGDQPGPARMALQQVENAGLAAGPLLHAGQRRDHRIG
jgi:hypothetical protein